MKTNNYFYKRDCPSCASDSSLSTVAVCAGVRSEDLEVTQLEQYWSGFFKEKSFFTYYRCPNCSLLFAPYNFAPSELQRLYANLPENMNTVPMEALVATQHGYFKKLQSTANLLKGDYLEIGPDTGLFLTNCLRARRFCKYWLFEPNQNVLPALNATLGDQENEIYSDIAQVERVSNNSIQTAVAIHVLDHLLNPSVVLRQLRGKIKKNGQLLIVTHDERSILSRLLGRRWPAYCLQHPQLFNFKTTRNILEGSGFRVLHQAKTTNYFEIGYLLRHLLWAVGIRFIKIPDISIFRIIIPLKLGNIITIATPVVE